ncbi:MAG: hypothetical protein AAGJ52_08745 [Pseudomonadota bacterium]
MGTRLSRSSAALMSCNQKKVIYIPSEDKARANEAPAFDNPEEFSLFPVNEILATNHEDGQKWR